MQKSEKKQKRKLKEEEVKEMKRQTLDVEQTIKTLKKEMLYHELFGLEERLQNECKALVNWQCMV